MSKRSLFDEISKLGRKLANVQMMRESASSSGGSYHGKGSSDIVEFVRRKDDHVWINDTNILAIFQMVLGSSILETIRS